MPPPIVDNSGLNIHGQGLGLALTAQLNQYDQHSATAAAIFHTAALGNVGIRLVNGGTATGGAAVGNQVTMDAKGTYLNKQTGQPKADGLKELAESTIFEVTNATNAAAQTAADFAFDAGTLPLQRYGRRKAFIEAESTWNVRLVVREMTAANGYVPSAWGTAQDLATAGSLNLGAFEPVFAALPHDTTKPASSYFTLPTEQFYAYQRVCGKNAAKTKEILARSATITRGGVAGLNAQRVVTNIDKKICSSNSRFLKYASGQPDLTCLFHVSLDIFARLAGDGYTVAWSGIPAATHADWAFWGTMRTFAPDVAGALEAFIWTNRAKLQLA